MHGRALWNRHVSHNGLVGRHNSRDTTGSLSLDLIRPRLCCSIGTRKIHSGVCSVGNRIRRRKDRMGFVFVISAPMILFILIVGLACYLVGRNRGRSQASSIPQVYGAPAPPPEAKT
ncbi:hypothetical protein LINGRAHAP2_LOCUS14104 [Linum grandiflorum]